LIQLEHPLGNSFTISQPINAIRLATKTVASFWKSCGH